MQAEARPQEQCLRQQISAYFESEQEVTLEGGLGLLLLCSLARTHSFIVVLQTTTQSQKHACMFDKTHAAMSYRTSV